MGRDTKKYEYVEVALPLDNDAVQAMLKYSEKSGNPLRAIIRNAAIELFMSDDDDDDVEERPSVVRKPRKKAVKKPPTAITNEAMDTAVSMLDDMGFDD